MKVELEMTIDEDDESKVMEKVQQITRLGRKLGFQFGELEIERDEANEDEQHGKQ